MKLSNFFVIPKARIIKNLEIYTSDLLYFNDGEGFFKRGFAIYDNL